MKSEDFDGIIAGLADAVAYAKGESARGRIVAGSDVKAIRQVTKLTQGGLVKDAMPPSLSS
ncbi:hypothetical protein D0Z70_04650 [Sphingobium terrigena]|uniref:Uncharacterized protein n=1 Tax=Sphingobium terrigena TaxID=2304063 RepID=A0A418YW46_9SPHN|nr:hypothetical protein [Sphingobium terrigena]RJG56643.1 hypothetical protein D0Z70_04650 [Sphingobium terrigena]